MKVDQHLSPSWFRAALAVKPQRSVVTVEGADLEVLAWGEPGKPGLLLMHGFSAHAHWWTFIAPLIAAGRRVVAFSLSGMGRSGWRDSYSMLQHSREAVAVAEATDLFRATRPPIIIGHSYGSIVARLIAHAEGLRFGGVIHVDGALPAVGEKHDAEGVQGHRRRVYPTMEEAVARFRFSPPQPCENPYLVEFIARTSLRQAVDAHGAAGWSWGFDPELRTKTLTIPSEMLAAESRCQTALVFGERSLLMTRPRLERIREVTPAGTPWIVIPDAGHHIMVDQPLALVATLRALLAVWQPSGSQRDAPLG